MTRVLGWTREQFAIVHGWARQAYSTQADPTVDGARDLQTAWRLNWSFEPTSSTAPELQDSHWAQQLFAHAAHQSDETPRGAGLRRVTGANPRKG